MQNLAETSRKPRENLAETSRKPRGNLSETSRKPLGNFRNLSETFRKLPKPLGNLSETSRKPRGNLAETSPNLSETFPKPLASETSRKPVRNLSETFRKHLPLIPLKTRSKFSVASEQLQKHGLLAVEQATQQVFTANVAQNVAQNCPILPVWLLECPIYQHVVHLLCH